MPLPAASILNASLLLILLISATAHVGDVNTTMFSNAAATSPRDDTEIYICYLCTGRNPLLIRYCPIYWDECHLVCYADASAATATAIPAAPAPLPPSLGSADPSEVGDEECYVMKLYQNGSYTIVNRLGCAQIARCLLSCGGGDMADQKALGASTAAPATTAAIKGSFPPPRVADFQRCGTQVNAPLAPPSGAVPGGGARRRR
ncbi:hypothetical protein PAHAL_9G539200 [Panicum hallii]|jgi:anaphase-promoting complex subunit 6|uniref:Uncharacterized protein n=1 Tax=Panicum hallii TaxID=206008 RepID=A0A2S3ISN8_9POAL|nr:uncharacterized protein LOC112873367 [Panicum hallii]PAN50697.1 hypothetical protein PAHAL_9G539200 [Panicum hallii]